MPHIFLQKNTSFHTKTQFILYLLHVMKPVLKIESASNFRTYRLRSISVHQQPRLTRNPIFWEFLSAAASGKVLKLSPDQRWATSADPSHSSLWFQGGRPSSQLPEERPTPSFEYPIPTSRKFSLRIYIKQERPFQLHHSQDTTQTRNPANLCQVRIRK